MNGRSHSKTSLRSNNSMRSLNPLTRRNTTGSSKRTAGTTFSAAKTTVNNGTNKRVRNTPSSDSDAEVGEVFFISNNRRRTSSNEYDGEPEDTDQ